jgi:hypothetical protein
MDMDTIRPSEDQAHKVELRSTEEPVDCAVLANIAEHTNDECAEMVPLPLLLTPLSVAESKVIATEVASDENRAVLIWGADG